MSSDDDHELSDNNKKSSLSSPSSHENVDNDAPDLNQKSLLSSPSIQENLDDDDTAHVDEDDAIQENIDDDAVQENLEDDASLENLDNNDAALENVVNDDDEASSKKSRFSSEYADNDDAALNKKMMNNNNLKEKDMDEIKLLFKLVVGKSEEFSDTVKKVDLLGVLEKQDGKLVNLLKGNKSLGFLLESPKFIRNMEEDMVLANEKFVTMEEFYEWLCTWRLYFADHVASSLRPPPRRRALIYGTGERQTDRWLQEQLLIPRKKRASTPLVTTRVEEEKEILEAVNAVNERLKASNLNRCPTGRLPGLGTSKSEEIIFKTQVVPDEKLKRLKQKEADRVFNEWLARKEAMQKTESENNQHGSLEKKKNNNNNKEFVSNEEKAKRKELAQIQFEEWKKKKDKEIKRQKQIQKAQKEKLMQELLNSNEENSNSSKPPATVTENKSIDITKKKDLKGFGKKDIKRLAPYFVQYSKNYQMQKDAEDGTKRQSIKRKVLHRLFDFGVKENNLKRLETIFKSKAPANDKNDDTGLLNFIDFAQSLSTLGFKITPAEGSLAFEYFLEEWGKNNKEKPSTFHNNMGVPVDFILSTINGGFAILNHSPSTGIKTATNKKKVVKSKRKNNKLDGKISGPVKRIANALTDCIPSLLSKAETYVTKDENTEEQQQYSEKKKPFIRKLKSILEETLGQSSIVLLEEDLIASCSEYWSRKRSRNIKEYLLWLDEIANTHKKNDNLEVVVDVADIRTELRQFYKTVVPEPKSAANITKVISGLESDEGPPPKCIEGTIWLDLMKCYTFPCNTALQNDNGIIEEETFVSYWMEKYTMYQQQSLRITSPTHQRRVTTATRRGKRSRKPIDSPQRSCSPKQRIRLKKFATKEQKEAKKEQNDLMLRTYSAPSKQFSPTKKRPNKQYLQIQSQQMKIRTAVASLATATTEQVVQVLNLQKPSPQVAKTIGAVCILVGKKPTWKHARQLFKTWPVFISMVTIASSEPPKLGQKEIDKIQEVNAIYLSQKNQDYDIKLVYFLQRWVEVLYEFMKLKGLVTIELEKEELDTETSLPPPSISNNKKYTVIHDDGEDDDIDIDKTSKYNKAKKKTSEENKTKKKTSENNTDENADFKPIVVEEENKKSDDNKINDMEYKSGEVEKSDETNKEKMDIKNYVQIEEKEQAEVINASTKPSDNEKQVSN